MCFDTWLAFKARFLKIIFFKTPQGTFYFYVDNFANNIGMEIILASVESSLNCLPDDTIISKFSFPTYSSLWLSRSHIHKLVHYGIRETCKDWFESYLTNRVQYTEINGEKSKYLNINTGIPQGSILGLILFLTYVNDINNCSNLNILCFFRLYNCLQMRA